MRKCVKCGHAYSANAETKLRCCGQPIRIDGPKARGRSDRSQHFYRALQICQGCEHWGERDKKTGCLLHTESVCRSVVDIANGRGCFDWADPKFSAVWGSSLDRDPLPKDCAVITGTDQRYIRGVYFLAWTLLRGNDVRLIAYLDEVPASDPHVQQMRSWGVEFRPMPETIDRSVPFHQTWRKPACIADALNDAGRVVWLDSDTSVNGSVREAFEHLKRFTFAAGHGVHEAANANGPEVHDLFGPPRRTWEPREYPCAGVVGFADRHAWIVNEWDQRCRVVVDRRDLWNPNMYAERMASPLKYHDQGILQDLLSDDTVDGETWSHFGCRRQGPVEQVLSENFERPERRICHYGGKVKPFLDWPAVLSWGDPRERYRGAVEA